MTVLDAVFAAVPAVWHAGWYGGWGWGGGLLFGPILGVFWIVAAAVVIWLVWRSRGNWYRGGGAGGPGGVDRARDILAERYARGELTTEEYRERLDQLG
jgi:putative membrane protein